METANRLFPDSSTENIYAAAGLGNIGSDPDVHFQDNRVARLLVLLRQLDESATGLRALPSSELSEILSSAIRLCGFVDPVEARDVIGAILDAMRQDVISTVIDAIEVQYPMENSP